MDEPTAADKLMAEVAANLEALVEHAMEGIAQPPRGTIKEVGHYKLLNSAGLKRKELDALQKMMDELAYNVAATIFATLDGSIQSDIPDFPALALVERGSATPICDSLHQAFADAWEDEPEE